MEFGFFLIVTQIWKQIRDLIDLQAPTKLDDIHFLCHVQCDVPLPGSMCRQDLFPGERVWDCTWPESSFDPLCPALPVLFRLKTSLNPVSCSFELFPF